MNEQLKLLIELQEIDSVIIEDANKIESLPIKLEQHRAPFEEAKQAFQKFKSKFDTLSKKKKDREMKLDEIQDQINKIKSRSKDVKTNKEYEAHLKEIEGFTTHIRDIEDEILSLMEDMESFDNELRQEEQKVKESEAEFNRHKKVLEDEISKAESEIDGKKAQRKEFIMGLDEASYKQYMNLLKKAGGLAVVPVKNEVCLGCNTNIPPQLYNDIRKNTDIHTCYYCKRILYFKEEPVPSKSESKDPPPVS